MITAETQPALDIDYDDYDEPEREEVPVPSPALTEIPVPRVMVVIPTRGDMNFYTTAWMFGQGPQVALKPFLHHHSGFIEDMRQRVTDLFLESGIEWLLMLDSDVIPSKGAMYMVERAEAVGAKLVAYPTPVLSGVGVASNLFMAAEAPDRPEDVVMGVLSWHDLPWPAPGERGKFHEIASAGLGCTLIHREVLGTMMRACLAREMDYPFRAIWKDGKLYYGEDQAFFLRANAAGFTVEADLDCWCSHRKNMLLNPFVAASYVPESKRHPDNPGGDVDVNSVHVPAVGDGTKVGKVILTNA